MFLRIILTSSNYRNFFIIVLCIILLPLAVFFIAHIVSIRGSGYIQHFPLTFYNIHDLPVKILPASTLNELPRDPKCSHYDCFNIYKCGHRDQTKIQIYVYPLYHYDDEAGNSVTSISIEFFKILKTIVNSPYYTPNPDEACILVPSIDTLNQNRLRVKDISRVITSLP